MLAVTMTALLLMLFGTEAELTAAEDNEVTRDAAMAETSEVTDDTADMALMDTGEAIDRATSTLGDLVWTMYGMLPRLAIAVVLFLLAWALSALVQAVLRRMLADWRRVDALATLLRLAFFLIAGAVALATMAGDARALLGSVGLIGLALSWALQAPIESFTGWLLNAFRSYYRVGDRIAVGEVFGDVYKIDLLTTTVWEAGGPGKPVAGEQPTGALITFPNWEVLRSNIINYSRDFPYVWDEIAIGIAYESDLPYTVSVIESVARKLVGPRMAGPIEQYQELLRIARVAYEVEELPKSFLSQRESWIDCTIRYLVPMRQRRVWATELLIALTTEIAKPEHAGRIVGAYPRQELRILPRWGADDRPEHPTMMPAPGQD